MPATAVLGEGLQPALQLCAYLQSLPEPGLGIAGFGKRDASHDVHLPTPLWWFRPGLHTAPQPLPGALAVTAMNDQHAYLRLPPEHELQVGDVLGFGISHPCTTFDKWSVLYEVDDGYNVVGAVKTYF
jgi:D-serine dehydratase